MIRTHDRYVDLRFVPKLEILALFGAMSLFFATIEYLIPKPLPYIRLGLANIPILLSLRLFDRASYFRLVILKVFAQALLHGTFASYILIFSLLGSISSAIIMLILHAWCGRTFSLFGIGIFGALCSSGAQGSVALFYIFGSSALIVLPLLMIVGLIGGIVVGILGELFWQKSRFVALLRAHGNKALHSS